nr:MAG TPA: hypothetical protein [Caudoviricetes sp.]
MAYILAPVPKVNTFIKLENWLNPLYLLGFQLLFCRIFAILSL